MTLAIIIIVIAIIGIIAANTIIRNRQEATMEENLTPEEYAQIRADQRTDAIIDELRRIHFWLVIIGIYIIIQIIVIAIIVIKNAAILSAVIELLSEIA